MVLHGLQNGVDGLLAEVVLGVSVEGVGLVDEEDAAQGALDDLAGLDGGLAHVSGHEAAAVHLHQLALGEDAERVVNSRHQPGHGGLAGAGIAGEDHVEGEVRGGEAVVLAELVDRHHVDEVLDLALDGGKADVAVQLRLEVFDLLLGLDLLHGGGVGLVIPGGGGGAAVSAVPGGGSLRGLGGVRGLRRLRGLPGGGLGGQQGAAPEVGVHALEVVLRHGADDLQLLEDDVVFLAAVAFHSQHLDHLEVGSTWAMARKSREERKPVSVPEIRDTPSSTGR